MKLQGESSDEENLVDGIKKVENAKSMAELSKKLREEAKVHEEIANHLMLSYQLS